MKLSNVSSRYGAPMGRTNIMPASDAPVCLTLTRLAWVDGDYDEGGAYWGGGPVNGRQTWIYQAAGEETELYVRAHDIGEARALCLERLPGATFAPPVRPGEALDAFTLDYLACAVWTLPEDVRDADGQEYTVDAISPEALDQAANECFLFQAANAADLAICGRDAGEAGHDFWLTRCGHGTGFWDRDFDGPEMEAALERLEEAARKAGNRDLYAGDDGQLYF